MSQTCFYCQRREVAIGFAADHPAGGWYAECGGCGMTSPRFEVETLVASWLFEMGQAVAAERERRKALLPRPAAIDTPAGAPLKDSAGECATLADDAEAQELAAETVGQLREAIRHFAPTLSGLNDPDSTEDRVALRSILKIAMYRAARTLGSLEFVDRARSLYFPDAPLGIPANPIPFIASSPKVPPSVAREILDTFGAKHLWPRVLKARQRASRAEDGGGGGPTTHHDARVR